MNREDLFQILGDVDEELLVRCDKVPNEDQAACQISQTRKRNLRWTKWVGAAACLGLILTAGTGIFLSRRSPEPVESYDPKLADNKSASTSAASPVSKDASQVSTNSTSNADADCPYVDINSLLNSSEDAVEEQVLKQTTIQLNGRKAVYESIPSEPSDQLKESIGTELAGKKGWYRLSGHEDAQYLIQKEKKNLYSLWEFDSFEDAPYSYKDVLEEIYGIQSVDDIARIVVSPAKMDNTDAGKALQKKIGVVTIDDPKELATVYEILSSLTCLGTDGMEDWKLIGLVGDTPEEMLYATRYGRYLTIITSQGNRRITHLKYNGMNDVFYQYGGIGYQTLQKKEAAKLEEILKIQ